MKYQVVVEFDPESSHYTATVAGIPSIVVDAKTERSAVRLARQAIGFHRREIRQALSPSSEAARARVRAKVVTVDV